MKWLWELIEGFKNRDLQPPKKEDLQPVIEKPRIHIDIPDSTAYWEGIVWHHSASDDHADLDNWASIKRYHTSWRYDGEIVSERKWRKLKRVNAKGSFQRPWSDIGYHGGVEREKNHLAWRMGRPWDKAGAHSGFQGNNYYNEKYIGLCAVGNYDLHVPDLLLWEFCQGVTREIMDKFDIPVKNVIGHREVYDRVGKPRAKTCPGERWDMDLFRQQL